MSGVVSALIWSCMVGLTLLASALFERHARLSPRLDRPELGPLRARWGGGLLHPPGHHLIARALAAFARMVRSRHPVEDQRLGLRRYGRLMGCAALATGLAMIPFAGTLAPPMSDSASDASRVDIVRSAPGLKRADVPAELGAEILVDRPLAPLDLDHGLAALALLLLFASLARVAVGLSERNPWSRLASVRQASRSIAALALLALILAPIAFASGSLRLHDVVSQQFGSITPFAFLAELAGRELPAVLERIRLPAWNLFAQPITAMLFGPTLALMVGNPRIDDPISGAVVAAGIGLDADAQDLYWSRLEARLSTLLVSALFVALFLGSGSLPFVEPGFGVEKLIGAVGIGFSSGLFLAQQAAVFLAKWWAVLFVSSRLRRLAASIREDEGIVLVAQRALPLAWANLLLVVAVTLLLDGGGAK